LGLLVGIVSLVCAYEWFGKEQKMNIDFPNKKINHFQVTKKENV